MASLADKAILSGADNRPPMLEKDMMILESVEQGPLIWPFMEVEGVTRLKKYLELSVAEANQADCDVKATNIILQGLPPKELERLRPKVKKSCLPPRWRLLMAQVVQMPKGKTGGFDHISNKDATILYCLANEGLERLRPKVKKSCLPPRWRLLMAQVVQMPKGKTGGFDHISNKDATILYCLANEVFIFAAEEQDGGQKSIWNSNLLEPLHKLRRRLPKVQILKLSLDEGKKKIPFTYNHPQSKIETAKSVSSSKRDTRSQTGHSLKDTLSSSAVDSNPIQPSASTHVVIELHKEDQQATGGPISLGITSKE
nr:hypothetical protein [Tanacetum cinerariifolium]